MIERLGHPTDVFRLARTGPEYRVCTKRGGRTVIAVSRVSFEDAEAKLPPVGEAALERR